MNLAEKLLTYCDDVLNGEILACKKHIQAIKRFVNDLKKQEDETFPYYFDMEEVEQFYEWSRLFEHTKGTLAGEKIEIEPFQIFICANLFGWKRKNNNNRRFNRVYLQLARKQAKSQLLSLMASYEAFLSGDKAEVYIAGWDKVKSEIVYKEILTQIKRCDFLKGKFTDTYNTITHIKSESVVKALSREAKNLDGLSPTLNIIDEFHTHKTDEIIEVLTSGSVRPNAMTVIITTAGFDLNAPCFKEYQYAAKVLEGSVENENFFALITELDKEDNWRDERVWIKANPLLATFEDGMDFLRKAVKLATDYPEKLRGVLTKNFNLWTDMKDNAYITREKWSKCGEEYSLDDFRGMNCIVGVDLSAKLDLTSIGILFYKDETIYTYSHSFIPSETVHEKRKTDGVDYDLWIKQGYITETEGAMVDYRYIEKYLEDLRDEYDLNILEVCSDPWNASQFMQNLETKGFLTVEIRQGMQTLGSPTKEFKENVYNQTLKHNFNPVLDWALSNCITKKDHNDNYMLDKGKATERIDPVASLINAMVRISEINTPRISLNDHFSSDDFSF